MEKDSDGRLARIHKMSREGKRVSTHSEILRWKRTNETAQAEEPNSKHRVGLLKFITLDTPKFFV